MKLINSDFLIMFCTLVEIHFGKGKICLLLNINYLIH